MSDKKTAPGPTVDQYITIQIAASGKTQKEIATELGYDHSNVITMIKQGATKLPITKVGPLAKALEIDAVHLLKLVLSEYMPETLVSIEEVLGRELISIAELEVIRDLRKAAGKPRPAILLTREDDEFVLVGHVKVKDYLAEQIKLSGKSHHEVARALRLKDGQTVAMILEGKLHVPVEGVEDLADVLGVDKVFLLRLVLRNYLPAVCYVMNRIFKNHELTGNEAALATPRAVIERMNGVANAALKEPALAESLGKLAAGYRGETKDPEEMRKRAELDVDYARNWSMWGDVRIMMRTVVMLSRMKAY